MSNILSTKHGMKKSENTPHNPSSSPPVSRPGFSISKTLTQRHSRLLLAKKNNIIESITKVGSMYFSSVKFFLEGDKMAKCYNRRILSDALADLGKALGRVPRQKDLTPEMASRSTYLRHFGDWKTALEYAGFVDDDSLAQESCEEQPTENSCNATAKAPEVKLINLCGKPIVFLDRNGESDVLPPAGKAYVCFNDPVQPVAAKVLGTIINDVPVVASRLRKITVLSDGGIEQKFPPPTNNTFYIVSEAVARNVYRFGRSSLDLLYPQSKYMANGVMYIETLGMVYTKNLPICSRQ